MLQYFLLFEEDNSTHYNNDTFYTVVPYCPYKYKVGRLLVLTLAHTLV